MCIGRTFPNIRTIFSYNVLDVNSIEYKKNQCYFSFKVSIKSASSFDTKISSI
jgi:hypothetical protein